MEAGAEGHARVERDDDVVGVGVDVAPGRPDDEPPADAQHREVLLPGVRPVLLVDRPRRQLADGAQPEGLEVAEVAASTASMAACAADRVERAAGSRGRWPAALGSERRREPLVDELEGRLDGRRRPVPRATGSR